MGKRRAQVVNAVALLEPQRRNPLEPAVAVGMARQRYQRGNAVDAGVAVDTRATQFAATSNGHDATTSIT